MLRQMQYAKQIARVPSSYVRCGLLGVLGASLLAALAGTRDWPLIGDAALMHYVVFLLRGGAIPYRQVVDINLPGTYFFESLGMALFGSGARGLRLYDWTLIGSVIGASVALTGRRRWFAGLFAGLLLALVHLQDGIAQQGQRDLLLAALLLGGLAALRLIFEGTPRTLLASFAFGLAFGVSFTVKPVLLPLALFLLVLGVCQTATFRSPAALALTVFGLVSPAALALVWLHQKGALRSFLSVVHSLVPMHAALGRRPLSFLLGHSFSPLGVLLLFCLMLLGLGCASLLPPRPIMVAAVTGALLAYLLQGKGYPYQRYPLLAVLLVAVGFVLDRALDGPGRVRVLAWAMVCWAGCLGVYFAWRAVRINVETPFVTALSKQLAAYGTPDHLAGEVQCLDTFGGCVNTLYDLRITQSTGFLYDCYLFTDPSPARTAYREQFWTALQRTRPRLVVLSSQNCFKDFSNGYDRVASWPALNDELHQHYKEVSRWTATGPVSWFSPKGMPFGFRLLLRDAQ